ncbi:MAG: ABC transporter permease [Deltaproteobacteria bacterium]|nr:ABC transporter permease [Deltaproteobacteria bacterium]
MRAGLAALDAPGPLRGTWAVLRRNMQAGRRDLLASAADLAVPLLVLLTLGYAVRYLAPGLLVATALLTASFEGTYGCASRMGPERSYAGILATPVGLLEILLGEVLFGALKAFLATCAILAVTLSMGLYDSATVLLAPVLCALCGLLFSSLAVLVAASRPRPDVFRIYFSLVVTPMLLFSGVFFPLELLPGWARAAAWFNPLTHAAAAARAIYAGRVDLELAGELIWLAVVTGLPLLPTLRLLRRRWIA